MQNKPPKIWLLASPHTGDNTQLMALAENLGWPYEIKKLSYRSTHIFSRFLPNSLRGLTDEARALVAPPYPDLILGAGQPTEPIALWIKQNAPNRTRVVYVGTPWAKLDRFDLVITTPQYQLPERANVLHIDLPLHKVEQKKLREAAAYWKPKLKHLAKPWTAVLVGGASGPYTFNEAAAVRLAQQAHKMGGSLLITTSARTPKPTAATLKNSLVAPHYFHAWNGTSSENPFFGFLALADQFIVTADSISMLSEACATGKPVHMFDTEQGTFARRDASTKIKWLGRSFGTTIFRIAMRVAPKRWSRDLRIVHQQLLNSGQATWLGDTPVPAKTKPVSSALEIATSRVKALFDL
jgi:uncharacterized protein